MDAQRRRILVRAREATASQTLRAGASAASRTIGEGNAAPRHGHACFAAARAFAMNAAVALTVVSDDAERFLVLLTAGERVTFQTFGEGRSKGKPGMNRIAHGTLAQHRAMLDDLNARGAGVFWMVNAGDGIGRKAGNVRRVRALFVDLDGAPLKPVQASPLPPHCIIESSPNRWHAYWCVADCPLADFAPLQKALAERFAADPKVCDLPRVMRLPGFLHRKGKPFASRIIELRGLPAYRLAELVQAFDLRAPETPARMANVTPIRKRTRKLPDAIPEGERNNTLLSLAAGLVRQGFDAQAVNDRLQRINADRCKPPLGADDVDGIAERAVAYGSDGFAMLSHKLLDSREWKALPPAAHDVILTAFRRYDGTNNGNIALTWADFAGREGFSQKHTFYRQRKRAVSAGILRQASEGRNGQTGRKPDLFSIATKWLRQSASVKKGTRPQCRKSTPLHR